MTTTLQTDITNRTQNHNNITNQTPNHNITNQTPNHNITNQTPNYNNITTRHYKPNIKSQHYKPNTKSQQHNNQTQIANADCKQSDDTAEQIILAGPTVATEQNTQT